jgi:hypothetical protein
METTDEQMSREESLRIISEMVQVAKSGISDNGFFYLFWGWLVFVASLAEYLIIQLNLPFVGWPWMILMPFGSIVSTVYGIRLGKQKKVKTYIDQFMGYVLVAFLVSLFSVLFYMSRTGNPALAEPMILMVYGAWLFISGGH